MASLDCNVISPRSESSSSISTENKFQDKDRAGFLLKGFSSLYEEKLFTDVILVIGDQEFPCHRCVLAISSPFFMAMFSTSMAESHQERVVLRDIDSQTMHLVLDYMYTGEVHLADETVQNLLSASNLFQLLALRHGCAEFMVKHVTMNNALGMYFFAKAHQCEALAKKAKEIINAKFGELCKEQELLLLPLDKFTEIIHDDDLNVPQEEIIYETCLAWLNYNFSERGDHVGAVMKHVRFGNISSYYFCDNIDTNQLLQGCDEITDILAQVKYYHMLKHRYLELDLNFLPRRGMSYEKGVVIMANPYAEDNNKKFNSMDILLPKAGVIKHLSKLPFSLYMPGACTSGDNHIYLAGGAVRKINYRGPYSAEGVLANLFMYDPAVGSWQVKAKMEHPRSQFSLVVLDGYLLAIGGQNESSLLSAVEKYDPNTNAWTAVAPLPKALRCITSVSYRGKVYVFGGETQREITSSAYRFDPKNNCWLELAPMQTARAMASSIVYKNRIYVIGGNSAVSAKWKKEFLPEHCVTTVEVFDPLNETWSVGPELPNALCGAGLIKYGESVMVVGGEDDKSWMAGVFILSEVDGKECWTEGHELPCVMSTFGCVLADIHRDLLHDEGLNG